MKLFYFARKLSYFSGWINLLNGIFAVVLIIVLFYYQFGVLVPSNYQALAPSATSTVQYNYANFYISTSGLKAFFQAPLGVSTYWSLFLTFYILTILTAVLKFIFSAFTAYVGFRNKNSFMTKYSIINIFIPFLGFGLNYKLYHASKKQKDVNVVKRKISRIEEIEESINKKINA